MYSEETRLRDIAELHCDQSGFGKPHTITIASGKGGVGKSTVALNLAIRLAELGNKTLLLDADENRGNIDVMTGISPELRLGHVLRGEKDIEDVLVSPINNLSVLPGNSGDTDYPMMTLEKQRELIKDISSMEMQFEYLIIDTSAGIGEDIINFAVHSDETIVVTGIEPTALMDAYALIKMITLADSMVPLKVIVNSVRSQAEGEEAGQKLQMVVKHFLQQHVHHLGTIPYDANVSNAIIRQSPLLREFPMSGAAISLQMLATSIIEQTVTRRVRRFQRV